MCRIIFSDPIFCPCADSVCAKVRPAEDRQWRAKNIPWRRHIVRGKTTLKIDGLPCDAFFTLPGAAEAVALSGTGDKGMWEVAILNCPELRPRFVEAGMDLDSELCTFCKENCDQGSKSEISDSATVKQ